MYNVFRYLNAFTLDDRREKWGKNRSKSIHGRITRVDCKITDACFHSLENTIRRALLRIEGVLQIMLSSLDKFKLNARKVIKVRYDKLIVHLMSRFETRTPLKSNNSNISNVRIFLTNEMVFTVLILCNTV